MSTRWIRALLGAGLLIALARPAPVAAPPAEAHERAATAAVAAPLAQFTSDGHVLGFAPGGIYAATGNHVLRVEFVKSRRVRPQTQVPSGDRTLPFTRVAYPDLWEGVSLVYDAPPHGVYRSTYTLEAGADAGAIRLRYNTPVKIQRDGSLSIVFESGSLTESAPRAWQVIGGERAPVGVHFTLAGDEVGFALEAYDPRYPITIDPTLTWSTFLGGSGYDVGGNALAVDPYGNIYVVGRTSFAAWSCAPVPCTARALSGTLHSDAFVAKLNSSGVLQWNTFLGTNNTDSGSAIAVDANGYVYVGGNSNGEWSCSPASCTVRHTTSGMSDFVAKLDASNGELIWNTFLDTLLSLDGTGLVVDGSGNTYVTGISGGGWGCAPVGCTVRPFTTGSHYTENDAHVAKIGPNGVLLWNTFLGGSGDDFGRSIALDGNGSIYVTGFSYASWGAPVRPFTIGDDQYHRNPDAFAAKLNANGELQWNTFLGGGGDEKRWYGYGGIAADHDGNAYVVADSTSPWSCAPIACTVRAFTISDPIKGDAFVAKVDTNGVLKWNTFLGCEWEDEGNGITVDDSGNVYAVGTSPCSWGSPLIGFTTGDDPFVTKLNPDGAIRWSTFLGGPGDGHGIALDNGGSVYVASEGGYVWGTPVRDYSGSQDILVAKLPNVLSDNANLSGLALSTGPLAPAFAANTSHYIHLVSLAVASLTVTPRAMDAGGTITVNATPVASGTPSAPINLAIGPNTITIAVTAENGTATRVYTVTVWRERLAFLPLTLTSGSSQ